MEKYNIVKLLLILSGALKKSLDKIGFDANMKNVNIRPSDIMMSPVINSVFESTIYAGVTIHHSIGLLTTLSLSGRAVRKSTRAISYAAELKPRAEDGPFMALVYSMVIEDELATGSSTLVICQ